MSSKNNPINYAQLPAVDHLLKLAEDVHAPLALKTHVARQFLENLRLQLKPDSTLTRSQVESEYLLNLDQILNPIRPVINATGVILHTGLGRAAYSAGMVKRLVEMLSDVYVNLELDLATGQRGNRNDHLRPWLQALTNAENGILVNNNAAAVLLALNTLANRKQVVISRGQLVEIGGSFRIPEILKKAGAKLVEVGTTNRTHLNDFRSAISSKTGLLLWVHTSNYRIEGFTKEVGLAELVELGKEFNLPVMADLGSGALVDIGEYGLRREPLVSEVVKTGVDVVTFSVDKLLGGPQGGVIAGKNTWINRIEKNHLLRALRSDKTQIILTLEALKNYHDPATETPFYRDISISLETLHRRAHAIVQAINPNELKIEICETPGQVGSGAAPTDSFQSVALKLKHNRKSTKSLAAALRQASIPVLGYINEDRVFLDLRTVRTHQDDLLMRILRDLN